MTPPRRPAWRQGLLAAAAGAGAATGLAPLGFWPLTLLGMAAAAGLFLRAGSARRAALAGWGFGAGFFGAGLSWIVEPFLVDPDRHAWMAPFALVFLASGLALFWGAAFWGAYRLGDTRVRRGLALVVLWPLAELARAHVLTGFPWAAPGQVWVGTAPAQLLGWIGAHGLNLLTVLAAVLPVILWTRDRPVSARLAGLLPVAALAAATLLPDPPTPAATGATGATVRLVQPNAPQHQKWDPEMMPVFFSRQLGFTAAGPRPDLVVWPETSVPALLENAGFALDAMATAAGGAPVVFGIQRFVGSRIYNSLAVLDGQGQVGGIYDKHHLVPFGEYIPFGDIAARFGLRGFAAQQGDGYSAGPGPALVTLPGLGAALPLICYEAVFPRDTTGTKTRPDFLLQITNDAWFGTWSGPYQHLAQARMRAIEQGLPMVRVANTGVSAMIGPRGQITHALPLGEAGFIDAVLPAPLSPTLYARSGDWPVIAALLAGFLMLLAAKWRSGRANTH